MIFDKSKCELVYHTTNHRDGKIIELATLCSETNRRLVLLIPIIQKYSFQINESFRILGDDLLIYEMDFGMNFVLANRAKKYVEYIKTSELYE